MNKELFEFLARPMTPVSNLLLMALLGLLLALLGVVARPKPAIAGSATSLVLVSAGALLGSVGLAGYLVAEGKWGYVLAFVPAVLIGRHAVFLRLVRRRSLLPPYFKDQNQPAGMSSEDWARFAPIFERARRASEREFSTEVIAIRYGLPALLCLAISVGAFELLRDGSVMSGFPLASTHPWHGTVLRGARFGAVGAYVFVLIYLGRRSVRRDVTSGAALWSAISLALGPIMGAIVAVLWGTSNPSPTTWTTDALYFVAGLAPRQAATIIEEASRRLWMPRDGSSATAPRLGALTQLRGIGSDIVERLEEEGITDAHALAMADPLKLYRNTNFDKRLILSWIDEAYLFMMLPEAWMDLQNVGISGAIDLATYGANGELELKAIADIAKIDEARLGELVARMYGDAQVTLIWALYQFDEDGSDEDGGVAGVASSSTQLNIPATPDAGRPADTLGVGPLVLAVGLGFAAVFTWSKMLPWAPIVGMAGAVGIGILGHLLRNNLARKAGERWRTSKQGAFALTFLAAWALVIAGYLLDKPGNGHEIPVGWVLAACSAACCGVALVQKMESSWASWTRGRAASEIKISLPASIAKVSITAVEGRERIIPVAPGSYIVESSAKGFKPMSKEVTVSPEAQSPVVMDMKKLETKVKVDVESAPSDVEFFLDGQPQSSSTFDVASPGSHTLVVSARGYNNVTRNIDVREGVVTSVSVRLTSLPARARVQVSPPDAPNLVLLIDDIPYAPSLFEKSDCFVELKKGEHTLKVSADGYGSESRTFEVGSEELLELPVTLRKK